MKLEITAVIWATRRTRRRKREEVWDVDVKSRGPHLVRKSTHQCILIAVFLGTSLGPSVLCGLIVLRVTDSQNCSDIGVSVEMHSVATAFARDVAP